MLLAYFLGMLLTAFYVFAVETTVKVSAKLLTILLWPFLAVLLIAIFITIFAFFIWSYISSGFGK